MQLLSWIIFPVVCLMLITCPSHESLKENTDSKAFKQLITQAESYVKEETTPPDAYLQKFDQDENVQLLKAALNQIGYDLELSDFYDEELTWAVTDFQIQSENASISGIYDEATKEELLSYFKEDKNIEPGEGLAHPPEEPEVTEAGTEVVGNPYDELALVNKSFALPEDYIPEDLMVPDVPFPFTEDLPKKYMRENAAHALEDLFDAAEDAGLELFAQSGYRSYDRQVEVFSANASQHGEDYANTFSARPGESEHQTGLAMDVTSAEVNLELVTEFGETEEGKWLAENAPEFGFIIRFPEGKEDITGYQYEPWHVRYVGEKTAKYVTEKGITFEEYIEQFDK
ncbi:D-alanyl-D-alanine carboxypeptidase family protein [Oceanobacillus sp. FSL W8-0428]|uniref:D-alanyl-D-alanine carboxypeptidase family protein n=1 Tax=Oceanobacillus sp. FSL W8-0428 TaxID=2921715 RepID=UPI0030F7F69A